MFFAGETSDLIEAELELRRRARFAGVWPLTHFPEVPRLRHRSLGGALDEVERRVPRPSFVVVDHLAGGVEEIGELGLRQVLTASQSGKSLSDIGASPVGGRPGRTSS